MRQDNALQVYYDKKLVGTLAMTAEHMVAFQYSDDYCVLINKIQII